jgi:hypothetical protein
MGQRDVLAAGKPAKGEVPRLIRRRQRLSILHRSLWQFRHAVHHAGFNARMTLMHLWAHL